ncbi:MAG: histidine kinase [Bacteroidota bacterium]
MKLLLTTAIILWSLFCFGQLDQLHFELIKGLKAPYNDFIYKDSRKLTWVSSIEGLFCYDGLQMNHYFPGNANAKGMLGKNIQSRFFEDRMTNLWFATVEGINCYRRKEGDFIHFQLTDADETVFKNDYCLFHLERDRLLWIKTNGWIYRYDIQSQTQQRLVETKGMRFAVDTLPDGQVSSIYACFWDKDSGFEIIEVENGEVVNKINYPSLPASENPQLEVSGAIVQKAGAAWLFSDQGLLHFADEQIQQYNLPEAYENVIKDGAVVDERYLLLAAKASGVWLFDTELREFVAHFEQGEEKGSLTNNNIREVYVDPQQHVWLGVAGDRGLNQTWLYKNQFEHPFRKLPDQLPVINSLAEDHQQNIWMSTDNNGVYVFDKNRQLKTKFAYKKAHVTDGSELRVIHRLSVDPQGQVWALNDQVIYRFVPHLQKWEPLFFSEDEKFFDLLHFSEHSKGLSTNKYVYELWYEPKEQNVAVKQKWITNEDQHPTMLFRGHDGLVYVPSKSTDLIIYRKRGEELLPEKTLSVNAEIYSVWEDTLRNVTWLGTLNGLFRLNKDWTLTKDFTDNKALQLLKINDVIGDEAGKLWLTTNRGLWHYHPEQDSLLQYQKEDGFDAENFALHSCLMSANHQLWLGTDRGAIVFNPASIHPYPHGPDIHIQAVRVNRNPIEVKGNLTELPALELNYQENTLEFALNGVTNYLPQLNTIHYQLKGYSEDWHTIANGATAEFIKVPDGCYALQIYSSNANGIKGPIRTLPIVIHPPFWKRFWFWLAVLTGIGVSVYYLSALMARRKLKVQKDKFERQQAMEAALQNERNRIAGEMHDDLGTELTLIGLLLNDIPTQQLPRLALNNLKKIEAHASKSIENMREIIWAMNGSYDNLPDLVAFIRRFVMEVFDDSDIECYAQIPGDFPRLSISGEKRRNILLCVKECVNNTLKHAQASQVSLSFDWTDQLTIHLKDNGKGFDFTAETSLGNGLRNMQERMKKIGGDLKIISENGTDITFFIPIDSKTEH